MYRALMMDSAAMMSPGCWVDFCLSGISDDVFFARLGALQQAVRADFHPATADDLYDAFGSGTRLTALVKKHGSNVVFPKTMVDLLEEGCFN
jgi:hypothetical protein